LNEYFWKAIPPSSLWATLEVSVLAVSVAAVASVVVAAVVSAVLVASYKSLLLAFAVGTVGIVVCVAVEDEDAVCLFTYYAPK
jgi:hypothetical protein